MSLIYLDNNATTPIDPEVLEVVNRVSLEAYGNPGSRHAAGRKARQILEDSREETAALLGAFPEEVIFTSGGTEASNLAVTSFTANRSGTIALPDGEHPATEVAVQKILSTGINRFKIPLLNSGQIDLSSLAQFPADTILLTTLLAHNETGTIQQTPALADYCEQHRLPFHLDAVQAVGKISVNFHQLNATSLSCGAHKFHGPRGVGALLLKKGCKVLPQIVGGHQEAGHRAGTEPVALIAGMVTALRRAVKNMEMFSTQITSLRNKLQQSLEEQCAPIVVNGDQQHRLANTLNISFPGCDAEALLIALDLAGICCSHGSACASGSAEPSPILIAMGCPPAVYKSAIRFSLGRNNTEAEITNAVAKIAEVVRRLR